MAASHFYPSPSPANNSRNFIQFPFQAVVSSELSTFKISQKNNYEILVLSQVYRAFLNQQGPKTLWDKYCGLRCTLVSDLHSTILWFLFVFIEMLNIWWPIINSNLLIHVPQPNFRLKFFEAVSHNIWWLWSDHACLLATRSSVFAHSWSMWLSDSLFE